MARETDPDTSFGYVQDPDGLTRAQVVAGAQPATTTATIAISSSLSSAVELTDGPLVRLVIPSAWTTANITFQTSYDGTNYADLYDKAGTEYTVTVGGASREIAVPIADWIGIRYIKVRSGTTGSAVNQAAARTIQLVMAP